MGCVTLRLAAWDPSRFFLEVEQQPKISSILAPPASTSQPQDPILQPGRTRSTPTNCRSADRRPRRSRRVRVDVGGRRARGGGGQCASGLRRAWFLLRNFWATPKTGAPQKILGSSNRLLCNKSLMSKVHKSTLDMRLSSHFGKMATTIPGNAERSARRAAAASIMLVAAVAVVVFVGAAERQRSVELEVDCSVSPWSPGCRPPSMMDMINAAEHKAQSNADAQAKVKAEMLKAQNKHAGEMLKAQNKHAAELRLQNKADGTTQVRVHPRYGLGCGVWGVGRRV
ncbi:hypothetical protein T484DRAFT_2487477 [Baffinella frigidus]|nr:hypothetical protein T484DRAFT_2487477 [Cryptophyta sp. CCMP2293]